MNKNKELGQITVIKVLMMLLVVLYHSLIPVSGGTWGGI
jgi:hypothetical protein